MAHSFILLFQYVQKSSSLLRKQIKLFFFSFFLVVFFVCLFPGVSCLPGQGTTSLARIVMQVGM